MKPSQLLDHFDRISEAPDAISRLRRFILGLAVRGKLVEHDQENESASTMLERVRTERARLVREQRIATTMSLPLIEETEVPFALPAHWEWVRVGDVFLYDAGDKREPRELDADRWLLELEDIERDTSVILARLSVADRHSLSTKSEFRAGDILYGKLRPYLNKVVVAREAGYSTTEIVAIRSFVPFCAEYSCLAFRRPDFVEYVDRLGRGTKMPRLRTPDALMALFPLPPLAEQYRIAAKVDELMALCDRLAAAQMEREQRRDRLTATSLHRLNQPAGAGDGAGFREHTRFHLSHLSRFTTRPDQIPALRQTILDLAVRGRLVTRNVNDEPASDLFKRIQIAKARLVNEGAIPRPKVTSRARNSLVRDCPMNWETVTLSDMCNVVTSGSRGWAEYYSKTGPKFIRAQNIRFGRLRLDDLACVSPPKKTEGRRTQVSKGDLLIVITGAGVTNPALLNHEIGEAYVSQHVALVRPIDKSLSEWILLCLMAPAGARAELVERAYGAGKPGLNLDNIRSLTVPFPPLAEQHRIVAKVHELIAVCDRLEAQLTAAQIERRLLLEAVLHEALASAA